jgi:hypothetical protein
MIPSPGRLKMESMAYELDTGRVFQREREWPKPPSSPSDPCELGAVVGGAFLSRDHL